MQQLTPLEYIKISVANSYGLNKKTWNERLAWFDRFLLIPDGVKADVISEAKEPILMQKALHAYHDALSGTPTGFIMDLDATASGIQVMACLIGCKTTATAVNLIDNGKRNNVYNAIAEEMGTTVDICKKPTMTYFYGSKAQPKEAFGDDIDNFIDSVERILPGAVEVMEDVQSCWQNSALVHQWYLPDGHLASVKNMVAVDKVIEIDELNHATFTHRLYENVAQKNGISLIANIVHSIDGYIVREMYRMAKAQGFELLTIHDSFWCSPNHMQQVRENYLDILIQITNSNLLQSILRQVTGNPKLIFDKYSNNLGKYMRTAEYALS